MGIKRTFFGEITPELSTRDRILYAAFELLVEGGREALTTRRVMEQAGVAKGTLYYHFKNMDTLLTETLIGIMQHNINNLLLIEGEHFSDYLRQFGEGVFQRALFQKKRGVKFFTIWQMIATTPHLKKMMQKQLSRMWQQFEVILTQFYPELSTHHRRVVTRMISVMLTGMQNMLIIEEECSYFELAWEQFSQLLIGYLECCDQKVTDRESIGVQHYIEAEV